MASVINSARRSTASAFDLIYSAMDAATQVIGTATRGIDMLDRKAELMHHRVTVNTKAQMVLAEDDEITKAATEHTDIMEEAHRRNMPNKAFDREAFYLAAVTKIQAAVEAA